MTKMEGIAAEVSQKLKSAIKAKLTELGAYVDDELSNYVMVMVTNRRSKADMDRELQLFLGPNTTAFTSWLQTVWQKLEQVTITNSSVDKRKATDKKKKTKKSSKTSSDSEDDKKHKKKRKSSVSDSINSHTRKKKFQPKETEDKKKDEESHARTESDSESDDQGENRKKPAKDVESANEEEDFLNIKEDFESEFLSDNEGSTSAMKNKTVSTTEIKKSQRPDADTTLKVILLKRPEDTATSKENSDKLKSSPEVASVSKPSESSRETKSSTIRKPLVRDHKTKSVKLKTRRRSSSPTNQPRSRSKSPLPNKIIKLKRRASGSASGEDDDDFNAKIQRSRLKSVAANAKLAKKSRSRSRSPLMSAAGKKLRRARESDGVLDARELINRKRAMCIVNEPVTKEKNELGVSKTTVSGGKMVRIRNRESSKENCRTQDEDCVATVDDVWPENGDLADDDRKLAIKSSTNGTGSKLIISRNDGKRSVIAHSSTSTDSSSSGNRRVDLRGIKRTVYIDEEDATKQDEDIEDCDVHVETAVVDEQPEKKKKKKKKINVDHLLKYIQPDKAVASTVVKLPKPPRPKTSPAQAASSTLIRKAMADAHKSTSLKDKRGALDSKAGRQKCHEKTSVHPDVIDDEIETNQTCKVVGDDDRLSIKSSGSGDEHVNSNGDECENMDEAVEQDEYEPAMSVPQFVVTLTGLDSNMFPKDDMDDLVDDMLIDDLEADMADMEENKNKLKNQERCKYYPNCLVGDQCLYYHPTIPCKLFPNCKFGSNCLYIHPKCKFDSMCTRYDCTFTHSAPKTIQSAPPRHAPPPPMMTAQSCKFYYNCVNPVCPYQHPKICRFDRFCTNKNCTFSHTSLTHVSAVSKDKLKWSRPKDTDFKMQPDSEMSLE